MKHAKFAAAILSLSGMALAEEVPELSGAPLSDSAQVIFVGEVHDNPLHHDAQAALVANWQPTALVFEMLDVTEAEIVMKERAAGRFDGLSDTLAWDNSGWPDFAMYGQIMQAAPEAVIYGAEVGRGTLMPVIENGAAAEFGVQAAMFGLDAALPDDQLAARLTLQSEAHCDALPEEMLPGFVEAQRFRDAKLADTALSALVAHGAPVVVITGNGHARIDWGAPALIALASPDTEVFSIAILEGPPEPDLPTDAWIVTDPFDRPDPCLAFQ